MDAPTAAKIADIIYRTSFRFKDEGSLQRLLSELLTRHGIAHEREVVLSPRDRIDLLAGKVGIEVKVDSSQAAVQRQLWRYAEHDCISHLILVTTRSKHQEIDTAIPGADLRVVYLRNSIF